MANFDPRAAGQQLFDMLREDPKLKNHETAIIQFYRSVDNLFEPARAHLGCMPGCSFCCFYQVVVQPIEVFAIRRYLFESAPNEAVKLVLQKAKQNRELINRMTNEEHIKTNIPCPLLVDSRCSVYPVRPGKCRVFHSVDANVCKEAYDDPINGPSSQPVIGEYHVKSNLALEYSRAAVGQAGLDASYYELNGALIEAITQTDSLKCWKEGERAFSSKYLLG